MSKLFKTTASRAVFLSLLFAGTAAWAYMLPGPFILGKVAEQRTTAGLDDVTLEGSATVAGPAGEITGSSRLRFKAGGFLELTVIGGHGDESFSIAHGKITGKPTAGMQKLVASLKGMEKVVTWALPGREPAGTMTPEIKAANVDLEKRSLGRFHGRVVFIVGADAKDRVVPQVWVDKDTFTILRVMLPDRKGRTFDIKLYDFQSPPLQGRFPATIEIYDGPERVLRFQAEKVVGGVQDDDEEPAKKVGK